MKPSLIIVLSTLALSPVIGFGTTEVERRLSLPPGMVLVYALFFQMLIIATAIAMGKRS